MSRDIKYADSYNRSFDMNLMTSVDQFPDNCPRCNVKIEPVFIYASMLEDGNIEIIFRCTSLKCGSHFISLYTRNYNHHPYQNQVYRLYGSTPRIITPPIFVEEIKEISPFFEEIYGQAYKAEEHKLNHIAGMGYRKALEFLIKDYLINFLEKDREMIENKLLGKCIKDDVASENIKLVAERAVWIGNDETHYVRKWQDKDVSDLKKLIDVTVHWITSEIITKRAIAEMQ